jgi:hypothetical protein
VTNNLPDAPVPAAAASTSTSAPMLAAPKTNVLAILSLIFGIFGFNIIAVIMGHVALSQIKKTGGGGRTLAIIGLVLGYLEIVAILIWIIIIIAAAATGNITVSTGTGS